MSSVTRTMTDGRHIGMTWPKMMRAERAPCKPDRRDVVGVADGQRLGPRDAGIGRPGGERDGDDRVLDARPQRRHEGERQDQARKGQEDVGDPHQDLVDPAAEIARDGADQTARSGAAMTATSTTIISVIRAP